jgi:SAM-dependent methyltransferase
VYGLDLSREMATLANKRLDAALVADMRALPFADSSLGGIVAFYSVIHLPRSEIAFAVAELGRALQPGGRALLAAHEGDGEVRHDTFLDEPVPVVATLFGLDELVAATRAAGLEVIDAFRRNPYPTESPTTRLYVEARRRAVAARRTT